MQSKSGEIGRTLRSIAEQRAIKLRAPPAVFLPLLYDSK
jgi:hypothetical protein